MPKLKPRLLFAGEWIVAAGITASAITLHFLRIRYAGPLWRDEVAALNLARMDSWSEIVKYFPHEAFPLLFPAILRLYTYLLGTGTPALRLFGFLIGTITLAIIWINAGLTRRQAPLIALTLFGVSPLFFIWADTIRAYGMGAAVVMITFGLFARFIARRELTTFLLALLGSLLSVHCLLFNAVLLFAIDLSATVVLILQNRIRAALATFGIGLIAALSITPYLGPYHRAREWDVVFRTSVSFAWLWDRFCSALTNLSPAMGWMWLIVFAGTIVGIIWLFRRGSLPAKERSIAIFAVSTCVLSLTCSAVFYRTLGYPTQDWYYLALIALLISTLDLTIAILVEKSQWVRTARLCFVLVILIGTALSTFQKARQRMTNMDLIAQELDKNAEPQDLILVAPWYLGISFNWYYGTKTPWNTLPPMNDYRVHRYDLLKEQMASTDPLGQLLKNTAKTLASGHRVWIVGYLTFPPAGQVPQSLAPAPYDPVGWSESAYTNLWSMQTAQFIQNHALHWTVQRNAPIPTNGFENVQLTVVDGWRVNSR